MRSSSAVRRLASGLVLACLLFGTAAALADDANTKMMPPIPAAPLAPVVSTTAQPPVPAVTVGKVLYLIIAMRFGLPVR